MKIEEKYVTLEKHELRREIRLQKIKNGFLLLSSIVFPVFLIVFLEGNLLFALLFSALVIAGNFAVYYFVDKYDKKIRQDFYKGKKLIFKGLLENKYRSGSGGSTMFYFLAGERKLKITSKDFYKYEIGQSLEIHIAPISGYVLSVSADSSHRPASSS